MEMVEILSIHSRGTKDGVEFAPSSMPLSALEAVITTIPKIVMGASIQSSRRSEIREAMRISIEEGVHKYRSCSFRCGCSDAEWDDFC